MTNEEKRDFIKRIDHEIGQNNIENIDLLIVEVIDDFDIFSKDFSKFILGYTGLYKKESKKWIELYKKINDSI